MARNKINARELEKSMSQLCHIVRKHVVWLNAGIELPVQEHVGIMELPLYVKLGRSRAQTW
jgi:hypothetical protein